MQISSSLAAGKGWWVRAWLACSVAAIVLTVLISLWRHPSAMTSSPVAAAVVLCMLTLLVAGYAWAATREPSSVACAGARVGLVVAALWLLEVLAGNALGDHPWAVALYFASIAGVLLSTVFAGYTAVIDGRRWTDGALAGAWSGLMSAPVPMLTLLALVLVSPRIVVSDPENIAEATHAGASDVLAFALGDDILAGTNHLWLGPALGLLLGALGGLAHTRT